MFRNALILLFALGSYVGFAQADTLNARAASAQVGKQVLVKDKIAGARLFERPDKSTFLINLAERYPDTPLTVVLYDATYKALNQKENLEDKYIIVKGVVTLYNGKAQIVIDDIQNLTIVP